MIHTVLMRRKYAVYNTGEKVKWDNQALFGSAGERLTTRSGKVARNEESLGGKREKDLSQNTHFLMESLIRLSA